MKMDLKIVGPAYINDDIIDVAVGVNDEKIVSISKPALAPQAEHKVVLSGKKLLFPAMVDIHVHMRTPGLEYKEDWISGSSAALAGGVTFVADMPNTIPPINTFDILKVKYDMVRSRALVDYGFYLGVPDSIIELKKCLKLGFLGIKVYPEDYGKLSQLFRWVDGHDFPIIIHAEDPEIIKMKYEKMRRKKLDVLDHCRIRPIEAEVSAIKKILSLIGSDNLRIHFTHISSRRGARRILISKTRYRSSITFDTCPHYFLLDVSLLKNLGWIGKVNPPLRSSFDRKYLFNLLRKGLVDCIVTDHAPHTLDEKISGNYDTVPSGFPGLETCLPLILTEVINGRLPLDSIKLYSEKPARILRIKKGAIRLGYDADFTVIDYSSEYRIDPSSFYSKAKFSPFKEFKVKAKVIMTFLRGNLVYDRGEIIGKPGMGRPVGVRESVYA